MARRFQRRRRRRVTWLPVFGNAPSGSTSEERAIGNSLQIALTGDGLIKWEATALTYDYTDSASFDQGSFEKTLNDLTSGNEWLLKRIVGKYFASWWPTPEGSFGSAPPVIDVAAGFIVCKTDDSGNPTTNFDEVNPLVQDSGEDPWIWRRRWFIKPYGPAQLPVDQDTTWAAGFPTNTAQYHSVADGPHIDQTTMRRIHRQERLFFVHAARSYAPLGQLSSYTTPGVLAALLDYRLLGSIAPRTSGNRGNASR